MLPGTTEGWVLSVKMYLWLGEVFTTTCLEKRSVFYFDVHQEGFALLTVLWELKRNTQLISGATQEKQKHWSHSPTQTRSRVAEPTTLTGTMGSQSPTARLSTKNYYLYPPSSPLLQDCTVQMRENQTMTTNIKAATAKNQHWFHISSINTKAWIFSPHTSTIPSCEASKKLMESPYRDLSLLFRSLTVEKKRGEFLYNK